MPAVGEEGGLKYGFTILARHHPVVPMSETETKISVVVTVLNATNTIVESLNSILQQDLPSDHFEVIVVDGGSTDGTREKLAKVTGIRVLDDPHGTIGSGRNVGIRDSIGEIIAITDADMVVEKSWLTTLSEEFKGPSLGAVGGPILSHPDCRGLAALVGELREESPRFTARTEVQHDLLYSRNIAYRRDALRKAGLFNESLVAAEDPELNWRIRDAGYELVFQPAMRVYHHHRSTLGSFLKQRYRNGAGCGQLLRVNTRLRKTRRRVFTSASFWVGIVVAAFFVVTGSPLAGAIFYTGLVVFTAFCLSRGVYVYKRTMRLSYLLGASLLMAGAWAAWSIGFLRGQFLRALRQAPELKNSMRT